MPVSPYATQIAKGENPSKTTQASLAMHEDSETERFARLERECLTNGAACTELIALDEEMTLSRSATECHEHRWPSCRHLFNAGAKGYQALLSTELPAWHWFKVTTVLKTTGNDPSMNVHAGTQVLLVARSGDEGQITLPQLDMLGTADWDQVPQLGVSIENLSENPITLHMAPLPERYVHGYERVLSKSQHGVGRVTTNCGPMTVLSDEHTRSGRVQKLSQFTRGVEIVGWTDQPIRYRQGSCVSDDALVYFNDDTAGQNSWSPLGADVAEEFEKFIKQEPQVYWYEGQGEPCLTYRISESQLELEPGASDSRAAWSMQRSGRHITLLGPTTSRPSGTAAHGGVRRLFLLDVTGDSVVFTGAPNRREAIKGFRPGLTRAWWKTKALCEAMRNNDTL